MRRLSHQTRHKIGFTRTRWDFFAQYFIEIINDKIHNWKNSLQVHLDFFFFTNNLVMDVISVILWVWLMQTDQSHNNTVQRWVWYWQTGYCILWRLICTLQGDRISSHQCFTFTFGFTITRTLCIGTQRCWAHFTWQFLWLRVYHSCGCKSILVLNAGCGSDFIVFASRM